MSKNEKMWPVNCPWPDPRYPQWGEFDVDEARDREKEISWGLQKLVEIKVHSRTKGTT